MLRNNLARVAASLAAFLVLTACGSTAGTAPTIVPTATDLSQAASPTTGDASTPTAGSLTKVTLALGYVPNVQFAPFYVALNRGYYRDEGLDVSFKNGIVPDLLRLLGAGGEGVSFAVASGDEIIPARLQGIPVVYVMTWYRQYPVAATSIVGKGPTLSAPADLKGHTIGIPGPFGANYVGLQALLESAGLTLDDVKTKNINFTQVESLAQGQVEIAMTYAANEPVQLESQGYKVSNLLVSDFVKLASNGLATNEKTLKENPNLVGKMVRATLRGLKDTIDNPEAAFEESLKEVPEAGGQNRDLQLKVLQATVKLMQPKPGDPAATQPLGWTDPDVWSSTQDFLARAKMVSTKGDVSQMFTNQFLPKQ